MFYESLLVNQVKVKTSSKWFQRILERMSFLWNTFFRGRHFREKKKKTQILPKPKPYLRKFNDIGPRRSFMFLSCLSRMSPMESHGSDWLGFWSLFQYGFSELVQMFLAQYEAVGSPRYPVALYSVVSLASALRAQYCCVTITQKSYFSPS